MAIQTRDLTRTRLRAEGFSCPSCVGKIERQVGRLEGVKSVKVYFASSRIEVDHYPGVTSTEEIIAAVAKAGYKAYVAAF